MFLMIGLFFFLWCGFLFILFLSIIAFSTAVEEREVIVDWIREKVSNSKSRRTVKPAVYHDAPKSDEISVMKPELPPTENAPTEIIPEEETPTPVKEEVKTGESGEDASEVPFVPITVRDDEDFAPPQAASNLEWEEAPADDSDIITDEGESKMLKEMADELAEQEKEKAAEREQSSVYYS